MGIRKFFAKQFRKDMLSLEHEFTSDFYVMCWQKNRSSFPLFLVRALFCLGSLAIVISSMVLIELQRIGHWFIFMTHWGVLVIFLATAAACVVSARAYFKGPIDGTFGLPWYVKTYWALFNIATTNSLFITIFFYSFLTDVELEADFTYSETLNFFVHGATSIIMLTLLLITRHPMRILHVVYPLGFAILYLLFNVIYYYAGGVSPYGTIWIYPMLDWSTEPVVGVVAVVGSTAAIIVIHLVVVALACARDALANKYTRSSQSISIVNQ